MHCSHCGRTVPDNARFCSACGSAISSLSELPTEVATPSSRPRASAATSNVGRIDPSSGGEFMPGQILDERYRVIGLLGRGGMGEVYRADDLKLGQAVALKFLPSALAGRQDLMDRMLGEVRNARQVSHPNVCRVYDVGEIGGRPFMTMEYVDGEDLATLLRRIGRLPRAKADQVARQMCAGLAAAHDRGVIHRDLKPSNVMLDGDGRVRITDFGLAVRGGDGEGEVAGTAAYMAPEQFDGRPATVQSDLYSLGLILYEIHTGKRALEAASYEQWRSQHKLTTPSSPSSIEEDVDEAVSRAILRCLEKDPSRRPTSALQLAAALPGGDPLAAALAAGETPSPQMVATAGGEGALTPRRAWTLLAVALALLGAMVAIAPYASDLALAPTPLGKPELEARAREITRSLGYGATVRDQAGWFERDYRRLKYVADHEVSTQWRRNFRDRGMPWFFVFRESPRLLLPANNGAAPAENDPVLDVTGMTLCRLDMEGHLRKFVGVPRQREDPGFALASPASWSALFSAASLDSGAFARTEPLWTPPVAFDQRAEWTGRDSVGPGDTLRVTAAAWRGRPVYFEVRGPWSRAERQEPAPRIFTRDLSQWVFGIMIVGLLVVGSLMARRNLRLGRGDRGGALRLFLWVGAVNLGRWALLGHHVADAGEELSRFQLAVGIAFTLAFLVAVSYLAVEPMVRRRTPELLIGWTRLIEGRWRDARVGRDVLVGALMGLFISLLLEFSNALPTWFPISHQTPVPVDPPLMEGGLQILGHYLASMQFAFQAAFSVFVAYFLLRLALRRSLPAALGLVFLNTVLSFGAENPAIEVPFSFVIGTLLAVAIVRFGLLTIVAAVFFFISTQLGPLVFDPSRVGFGPSVGLLAVALGLVLAAFRISLGPRPLFQFSLDE